DEVVDGQWAYRRNPGVRLPLERLGRRTATRGPRPGPGGGVLFKRRGARRTRGVRLPRERRGRRTATGLPYLRPEVVLLYKSRRPREPDEHDARVAVPRLSGPERAWLAAAIAADVPDHYWLPLLA